MQNRWPRGSGIYGIVNLRNGRVYVGQGGFNRRWPVHIRLLNQGRHHCKELQADWQEYGTDAFEFRVLLIVPNELSYEHHHLDRFERDYINQQRFPYNADYTTRHMHPDYRN